MLDTLLVDAASAAGAEVREGFTVDEIVVDDGRVVGIRGRDRDGRTVTEHARVVIGADGANSRVAKAVQPEQYNDKPILQAGFYTYFADLPVDGFEITIRPDRGWAAMPTNDGLTLVVVGWPYAEHAANKTDVEGNFFTTLELSAPLRRAGPRRDTRRSVPREPGPQLLPQALRTRLGARRRRRLHQGPDHRPGDQQRVPRRRALRGRARRDLHR